MLTHGEAMKGTAWNGCTRLWLGSPVVATDAQQSRIGRATWTLPILWAWEGPGTDSTPSSCSPWLMELVLVQRWIWKHVSEALCLRTSPFHHMCPLGTATT